MLLLLRTGDVEDALLGEMGLDGLRVDARWQLVSASDLALHVSFLVGTGIVVEVDLEMVFSRHNLKEAGFVLEPKEPEVYEEADT